MPLLPAHAAPGRAITDQLRRSPLFASLPGDRGDCLALLRDGGVFEVPAGIEIVSAGDAPVLLLVTEGALVDPDNGQAWAAGSCLGISESLAHQAFATPIRTAARTVLYRLDGRLFEALLAQCPSIARAAMALVAAAGADQGHVDTPPPHDGADHDQDRPFLARTNRGSRP